MSPIIQARTTATGRLKFNTSIRRLHMKFKNRGYLQPGLIIWSEAVLVC
jgi:hypothetical protein